MGKFDFIKGLVFESDNPEPAKGSPPKPKDDVAQKFATKFPSIEPLSENVTNAPPTSSLSETTSTDPTLEVCESHMDDVMQTYNEGFEKLNKEGVDFFEYMKVVTDVNMGLDNPVAHQAAISSIRSFDSSVNKKQLLEDGSYYVDKITEVHTKYHSDGNATMDTVLQAKDAEKKSLADEISRIDKEMAELVNRRNSTQASLSLIDEKYTPRIKDIRCKLMANDMAAERIVGSINAVIQGIETNINK